MEKISLIKVSMDHIMKDNLLDILDDIKYIVLKLILPAF